jgi:hypothetical protein
MALNLNVEGPLADIVRQSMVGYDLPETIGARIEGLGLGATARGLNQ